MKNLKVIAFTHKHVDLKDLGNLVICNEELEDRLMSLKNALDIPEIFYIATCNRVEFVFCGAHELTDSFIADFMQRMNFCTVLFRSGKPLHRHGRFNSFIPHVLLIGKFGSW